MKIILFLSILLLTSWTLIISNVSADIISPYKQLKSGIPLNDVVCNEDLVKMADPTNNKIICVKTQSSDFFVKVGWTIVPDAIPQVAEILDSIKTVRVIKGDNLGVKKSTTSNYDYVFEVCAGSVTLVAPEVIIKSDIDTKTITLANDIPKNSCLKSVQTIIAVIPDSIHSELTKQDDIVSKISSIKDEINVKAQMLDAEKKNFAKIILEPINQETRQKLDDSTTKITTLRQSMNDLKDDLNRYYFILYKSSKISPISKVTFDGSAITGSSVKVISSNSAPKSEGVFDVVIEVCAGNNSISTPIVEMSSDTKQNTLKLTSVASNSCYKTGAKINAVSSDSISVKFADSVSTISTLEEYIKMADKKLAEKRNEMIQLTENTVNPDTKQIRQLANEITALRDDLVKSKFVYYQNLYKAYK